MNPRCRALAASAVEIGETTVRVIKRNRKE